MKSRTRLTRRIFTVTLILLASSCASTSTIRPFSADGCSRFPDGTLFQRDLWKHCCYVHDTAYWRGGSRQERRAADQELRQCVDEVRNPALAMAMYSGVRVGGGPWWPTRYRWGYGWPYGRGYRPLTEEEEQASDEALDQIHLEEPLPTKPESPPPAEPK